MKTRNLCPDDSNRCCYPVFLEQFCKELRVFGHVILPTSPLPGLCFELSIPVARATGYTTTLLRS